MNAIIVEPDLDEDEVIEQLDEIYGEVSICGYNHSSGQALKELDPIAFHEAKLDLENNMEVKYECGVCGEQFDDEDEANECCQPEETNENEEDE